MDRIVLSVPSSSGSIGDVVHAFSWERLNHEATAEALATQRTVARTFTDHGCVKDVSDDRVQSCLDCLSACGAVETKKKVGC